MRLPWRKPEVEERAVQTAISLDAWAELLGSFSFQGLNYTLPNATQEDIGGNFTSLARAFKSNAVVFACIDNRVKLFSEARFMFRRLRSSRPGDLFGTAELQILNVPWPGGTTGDLLARMLLSVDVGGNAYVARRDNMLVPLRPDWVTILAGVPGVEDATIWHPDAEVLGYAYQEGGRASGKKPMFLLPQEVAHFAPIPDPEARFRGMSWVSVAAREIMADNAATDHKLKFFENGATPNMVVKTSVESLDTLLEHVEKFKRAHEGAANAYKTIFLTAGSDVEVVGKDLQQIDFKVTQGAGETRVAAAAGVPPVVVGLSEGLQGSSLNAGNFQASMRRFADITMRPLWRNAAQSLARVINVPSDAELWYDARDISALQEDHKDAADIMAARAAAVRTFVEAGYEQQSAVDAVSADDMTLLVPTGYVSVQLQQPGAQQTPPEKPPSGAASNGRGETDMEMLTLLLGLASRERLGLPSGDPVAVTNN